jgi:hypothetical protein
MVKGDRQCPVELVRLRGEKSNMMTVLQALFATKVLDRRAHLFQQKGDISWMEPRSLKTSP